ncbi:hypothetical protein O7602_24370 [Micromonospora sp. WMMD1128]|uniref:hypothetical protein n=1 Tax=unclassified Micromonospora TaxID=2617518 RepID=UPI00248C0B55|nr:MULTISPECIES: hypothetical protein [unclassified Micromonospora]WBB72804.1 hypothetical protein O7602_24370 [Micromonospora sp. WMMD1128]WFE33747.1 hypothetical protein O7613_30285 [Micromonospora sp. WMMD975]
MKTPRTVLVALLAAAALTACAEPGDEPAGPSPTGAATVTSQSEPAPSTSSPDPTWKGGPSTPPGVGGTTLNGTIRAGVEPNCLLLDDHLLVGGPRDLLKPGAKVQVTGRPEPGMVTTCQQGTPFVVESARRA